MADSVLLHVNNSCCSAISCSLLQGSVALPKDDVMTPKYVALRLSQVTYLGRFALHFVHLCWIIVMFIYPSSAKVSGDHHIILNFHIFTSIYKSVHKSNLSNVFCAHLTPYHHTPSTMLHCHEYAFAVVVLVSFTAIMLDLVWAAQTYPRLLWPNHLFLIVIRLLFTLVINV